MGASLPNQYCHFWPRIFGPSIPTPVCKPGLFTSINSLLSVSWFCRNKENAHAHDHKTQCIIYHYFIYHSMQYLPPTDNEGLASSYSLVTVVSTVIPVITYPRNINTETILTLVLVWSTICTQDHNCSYARDDMEDMESQKQWKICWSKIPGKNVPWAPGRLAFEL